jgi:hypothetical protein
MTVIDLTNTPATQKVAVANPDGTTPLNVALVSSGGTPDSYGAGAVDAGTQRMTQASDSPLVTGLGAIADAAVTNPASSASLIAATKGVLTKVALFVFGAGTAAAAQRTTLASDDPLVSVAGATSGAAVITDAAGTIQQYLRGLVKRWVDALGAGTAAAALRVVLPTDQTAIPVNVIAGQTGVAAGAGAVGATVQRTTLASDDPLVAVSGATSGAKVVTDANGTIQQYLRGLVYRPAGGAQTSVAAAVADTSLLAANTARFAASIFNDSSSVMYLLAATGTASATVKTLDVAPGGYYETLSGYTGQVRAFWVTATGNARIVEYT